MQKVTCIYLENCPYCKHARKALNELSEEYPIYKNIEIEWIEESQQSEIANNYIYKTVPCMFIEKEKIYEAHFLESYKKCKINVKHVLDTVIERK